MCELLVRDRSAIVDCLHCEAVKKLDTLDRDTGVDNLGRCPDGGFDIVAKRNDGDLCGQLGCQAQGGWIELRGQLSRIRIGFAHRATHPQ